VNYNAVCSKTINIIFVFPEIFVVSRKETQRTWCYESEQAMCIKLIVSRYIMTKVLYEHKNITTYNNNNNNDNNNKT